MVYVEVGLTKTASGRIPTVPKKNLKFSNNKEFTYIKKLQNFL